MANPSSDASIPKNANTVFIDTNLNTHLALIVEDIDTVSDLKKKILYEHPLCFPSIGDVEINAIKVKRRGHFYHLSDSMVVKSAFEGINRCWFLSVDASTPGEQMAAQRPPYLDSINQVTCKGIINHPLANGIDVLLGGPPNRDVSKHIELNGQCADDDYCHQSIMGTNKMLDSGVEGKSASGRTEKISGTEDEGGRSLTSNSNKESDPMDDDTNVVIIGDNTSRKHTISEVTKIKKNVFDTVVDSKSKRSLEAPPSSRPAKKHKVERKSDLKGSSKGSKASLIESKKEASELSKHSSGNNQKSKDAEGKLKRKKKSSKPQYNLVSAVLSSGNAGTLHEHAQKKPNSALLTDEDLQAAVQFAVEPCGFTVNSKQPSPIKEIGINSSSTTDVERMYAHAVEEIQHLNDDGVINEKGQPPVDVEDGNNQNLQIRASKSEIVILNNNCDSVSHQMDDSGEQRDLLEKTELRSTVAEMASPSTHEKGKAHLENSVFTSKVSNASEMAGKKESKKKRKKPKGTKKTSKEVAAVPEFVDSSAGVQSLNNDGVVTKKGQYSADNEDAINDIQQAGESRIENVILNNNYISVSHNVDNEEERELIEENHHRSTATEVPGPSVDEEGKTHLEESSKMAGQKKSTKKRKKPRKSNDEAPISAEAEVLKSSVEVQNLNNLVIISKDQPPVDTEDADNRNIQIGASSSQNVILSADMNSVSRQMDIIGKENDLSVKNDHRSTAEMPRPSTQEEGKKHLENSVVPSKISDSTELIGQKESTKKRKKRKEIKESNEEATIAGLKECIKGITSKEDMNVDLSHDRTGEKESILSEPLGKDLSDSKTRSPTAANLEATDRENHGAEITEHIGKSKENGENIICKVKKNKKRVSAENHPEKQIKGKHISHKDSDPAIKHADEEVSFESTKKIDVAETSFVSQSSGSNQEREKANAIDGGHYITQNNSGNTEFLLPSDTGNKDSLQPVTNGTVTNDGTAIGTKIDKEVSCESDRINFRDYFVPKQNPNEALTVDEVTTAIRSTKKNKKKRGMHSEGVSDFQGLPRSNENQKTEGKPQVGESNSIHHDGSSSKNEHNEFMRPTSKKYSEDSVKGVKIQASSNSNKRPSVSGKARKPTGEEDAIDLSKDGGFATPCSSLEISKQVTTLSKRRNDTAIISSGKSNGEVVDGSDNEKSLLAKSGASIWEESSEGEETTIGSDNSTKTPSDNNSVSSAYSDGESTATLNSPQTGPQYSKRKDNGDKFAKLRSMAQKGMSMDNILRSSSRYKRAKLTASQSEIEDTESQPVPDSQPNI